MQTPPTMAPTMMPVRLGCSREPATLVCDADADADDSVASVNVTGDKEDAVLGRMILEEPGFTQLSTL